MRLGKYGKLLHLDKVTLGTGTITRFTLVELKFIGGIILNIFNTTTQDRFHTHAFPALSFMLKGFYNENILHPNGKIEKRKIIPGIRYIPTYCNHQILDSSRNAISITIMGPWGYSWSETNAEKLNTRIYTWGRRRIV